MWPFKNKTRKIFEIPQDIPVFSQVIDPDRNVNIMLVAADDFSRCEANPMYDEFGCIVGETLVMSKKSKCKRVIFR